MTDSIKQVASGATAKLLLSNGTERVIMINHGQSDPDRGVISDETPLARAIMGAKAGDSRTYCVLDRQFTVKVLDVK